MGGVGYAVPQCSGVFEAANEQNYAAGSTTGGTAPVSVNFRANHYNSIYGNSAVVTPQSQKTNFAIKY